MLLEQNNMAYARYHQTAVSTNTSNQVVTLQELDKLFYDTYEYNIHFNSHIGNDTLAIGNGFDENKIIRLLSKKYNIVVEYSPKNSVKSIVVLDSRQRSSVVHGIQFKDSPITKPVNISNDEVMLTSNAIEDVNIKEISDTDGITIPVEDITTSDILIDSLQGEEAGEISTQEATP